MWPMVSLLFSWSPYLWKLEAVYAVGIWQNNLYMLFSPFHQGTLYYSFCFLEFLPLRTGWWEGLFWQTHPDSVIMEVSGGPVSPCSSCLQGCPCGPSETIPSFVPTQSRGTSGWKSSEDKQLCLWTPTMPQAQANSSREQLGRKNNPRKGYLGSIWDGCPIICHMDHLL